jgi:hypothetical protein
MALHKQNQVGHLLWSKDLPNFIDNVVLKLSPLFDITSHLYQFLVVSLEMQFMLGQILADSAENFLPPLGASFGNWCNFCTPCMGLTKRDIGVGLGSEEMLAGDCRPQHITVESGLTKVDEIVVKFVESCFAFVAHGSNAVDDAIQANVDFVIAFVYFMRTDESFQLLDDVHLSIFEFFALNLLNFTLLSWCICTLKIYIRIASIWLSVCPTSASRLYMRDSISFMYSFLRSRLYRAATLFRSLRSSIDSPEGSDLWKVSP